MIWTIDTNSLFEERYWPSFRGASTATPATARYLVYDGSYDWQPSETRELPEDDFAPGPGQWVVTDSKGNIIDRFADFDERN
ncbi:hypothetical protein GCM10027026_05770 [Myroides odoratimimus subsp. xuanwuensis]